MADLVTVFRTQSPIEAEVVKGLLEAHAIAALVQSDMPRTPFPMTLHELRLSVAPEDADRALRRPSKATARSAPPRVIPSAPNRAARTDHRVPLSRPRAARHALTHRSRVHETPAAVCRQRIDGVPGDRPRLRDRDMLFREFRSTPKGRSRSEGLDRLGDVAGAARRPDRSRRYLILGTGEERPAVAASWP